MSNVTGQSAVRINSGFCAVNDTLYLYGGSAYVVDIDNIEVFNLNTMTFDRPEMHGMPLLISHNKMITLFF